MTWPRSDEVPRAEFPHEGGTRLCVATSNGKETTMQSTVRRIGAITLSAFALAACQDSPVGIASDDVRFAAVDRVVSELLIDLTGFHYNFSCDAQGEPLPIDEGELVRLEGSLYSRVVLHDDGNGGEHFRYQTMPVGLRGVGEESGEEFRVSSRDRGNVNEQSVGQNQMWRHEIKLTSTDTGRSFWFVSTGHYRLGPDGEPRLERESETIVCKPGR
jgi:hypothetical protein